MVSVDWRGEHLIRAPQRAPVPMTERQVAELKAKQDLALIRAAVTKGLDNTVDIGRVTGLTSDRVYKLCRAHGIKLRSLQLAFVKGRK